MIRVVVRCQFSKITHTSHVNILSSVAQLCLTLCDPMDCTGSSVQGILQERILEWVAMPSSRGPSQPKDRTWVSYIAGRFFTDQPTSAHSVQFSHSVVSDSLRPMDCSVPGFPVHHQLPEPAQTHAHWVSDAIQPSHPLSSPSPPAFNLSQHRGLFQWVSSLHQVAKVLISSRIASGCFCITIAEVSHCNEDYKA